MKVTSLIMIKPYWKRESKSLLEKRKKKKNEIKRNGNRTKLLIVGNTLKKEIGLISNQLSNTFFAFVTLCKILFGHHCEQPPSVPSERTRVPALGTVSP